jgi:hypothetical protein
MPLVSIAGELAKAKKGGYASSSLFVIPHLGNVGDGDYAPINDK